MVLTKEQFEADYTKRSGLTVIDIHDLGLWAEPCHCGLEDCHGWAMVSAITAKAHKELYVYDL